MTDATTETFAAHCVACVHTWDVTIPLGVQEPEWSAAVAAVTCPKCAVVRGYGSALISLDQRRK